MAVDIEFARVSERHAKRRLGDASIDCRVAELRRATRVRACSAGFGPYRPTLLSAQARTCVGGSARHRCSSPVVNAMNSSTLSWHNDRTTLPTRLWPAGNRRRAVCAKMLAYARSPACAASLLWPSRFCGNLRSRMREAMTVRRICAVPPPMVNMRASRTMRSSGKLRE